MKRTAQIYLIVVSIAALGIFFILHAGNQLSPPVAALSGAAAAPHAAGAIAGADFFSSAKASLLQNGTSPLGRLFL